MTRTWNMRAIVALVVLAVLTGCGPMPESTPTAAPETTPPTAGDHSHAGYTGARRTDPRRSRAAGCRRVAGRTFLPGHLHWIDNRDVCCTRYTCRQPLSTAGATPMATPGATPLARARETFVLVREVVLPDRQRQELSGLGPRDHEAIAVGNELFVRGPLVEEIAPGTAPDVWIELDPETIPEGAVISQMLGGLPQLAAAPLASLPERLLPQVVREIDADRARWTRMPGLRRRRHRASNRDAGRLHHRHRRPRYPLLHRDQCRGRDARA